MSLEGRVSVVLGGARGIGKAYCHALLENGAKVVCGDILEDLGHVMVKELSAKYGEGRALFVPCDVTKSGQIDRVFFAAQSTFGNPTIVAHNAGMVDEFDWETTVQVNLVGAIHTTNIALQYMSKVHGGSGGDIVLASSMFGLIPSGTIPIYAATKHAIVGLARSWGDELVVQKTGVRVNCICPWLVDTELLDCLIKPGTTQLTGKEGELQHMPKLSPSDIGAALVKVLTDVTSGKALQVTVKGSQYAAFPPVPDLA